MELSREQLDAQNELGTFPPTSFVFQHSLLIKFDSFTLEQQELLWNFRTLLDFCVLLSHCCLRSGFLRLVPFSWETSDVTVRCNNSMTRDERSVMVISKSWTDEILWSVSISDSAKKERSERVWIYLLWEKKKGSMRADHRLILFRAELVVVNHTAGVKWWSVSFPSGYASRKNLRRIGKNTHSPLESCHLCSLYPISRLSDIAWSLG